MTFKRVRFMPDATLAAAEAGKTITDILMTCRLTQVEGHVLVEYGLPAEYWDVVVQVLRESQTLQGKAIAESMLNAINEIGTD